MNLLITGIHGYIGSVTTENLVKNKKINIIGIDNLKSKRFFKYKNSKIKTFKINYGNEKRVNKLLQDYNINTVLHCAANTSVIESIKNPKKYLNDFVLTKKFINVCLKNKVSKFIFLSSAAVYKNSSKPISEKSKVKPSSPYGLSKRKIEIFLKKKSHKNFNVVILRLFNVIGSHSNMKAGQILDNGSLIIKLFKSISNRKTFYINGEKLNTKDGSPIRDFFDVNLIAFLVSQIMNKTIKKYDVFNVGSGKGSSVNFFLSTLEKLLKRKVLKKYKKANHGEIISSVSDIEKLKKIFRFKKKYFYLRNSIKMHYSWLKKYYEKK